MNKNDNTQKSKGVEKGELVPPLIERIQSITLQSNNSNSSFLIYDPKIKNNFEINFIPDVCIVRSATFCRIRSIEFGYAYDGQLLIWSNLNNNFIAALPTQYNSSNSGTALGIFNMSATTCPNSVIVLKQPVNQIELRFFQSSKSTTQPFNNTTVALIGYIELTLDFIKYKE